MGWLHVLVWGGVGAAGIGIAWLVDGWAQRNGKERSLALVGLLPVLIYLLVGLGTSTTVSTEHPHLLIAEVLRVEREVAGLFSSAGAIAAAILVGLLARRSWRHVQQGGTVDLPALIAASTLGVLGLGGALAVSLAVDTIHPADPRLVLSVFLVLLACIPGAAHAGEEPVAEARHRLESAVFAALAGLFLVVSFSGRSWADVMVPMWWPVLRSLTVTALWQGIALGLMWGSVPLLVGLATLVGHLRGVRPAHLISVGAAAGALLVLSLPVPWAVQIVRSDEALFDFEAVAAEVGLPVDTTSLNGPVHGCVWRWAADGGELVSTQALVPAHCDGVEPGEAEFLVAPAELRLVDLPIVIDAPYATDVLILMVRNPASVPYPLRLVMVQHDPDGEPMEDATLQEIVDRCQGEGLACNLEPWAR